MRTVRPTGPGRLPGSRPLIGFADINPVVLGRFGGGFVGRSGDEVIYLCPYCVENGKTPDTKGHLYVNNKTALFYCHRCGAKGKVDGGSVAYGFDPIPSDEELMGLIGEALDGPDGGSDPTFAIPPNLVDSRSECGRYLASRGITPAMVAHYSIRQGTSGRWSGRVVVPNRLVATDGGDRTDIFVGRYCGDIPRDACGHQAFPKYLNPPGANKSHCVFNLHRIPDGSPVVVCEGVFSAMSAGSSAVAIYGKAISDRQLSMILSKSPAAVYVCLDPDARREALALCYRLVRTTSAPVFDIRLPDGHDPNSLGHETFMGYLGAARRFDPIERDIASLLG